jgi:MOSC domain-containing protein YiiM
MLQLTREELEAGLKAILEAPKDGGILHQIVRRPRANEREMLGEGALNPEEGLAGDSWRHRGHAPHPDVQLTLMGSRTIGLIAQEAARWALAGDQLFVDLDLSVANLPPGTRLSVGAAVIEISEEPHTGCAKFVSHFGVDAMKFVNSPEGRRLRLRGLYARVVRAGAIRVGDLVCKIPSPAPTS